MNYQIKFQSILTLCLVISFSLSVSGQGVKTYYHHQVHDLAVEKGQALLKATGEPISGRLITNYDDGGLRLEGYYLNGQKQGTFRWWYPSGELGSEELFESNKKEGECRMWYANGQIKQLAYYRNGELKGKIKYWNEDGSVKKISKRQ